MRQLTIALALTTALAGHAAAAEFDGSKKLICAPYTAMDCADGAACVSGTPSEMGAPAFIRVDVPKREVVGTERTLPIMKMEQTERQLLLQGVDREHAWALAISAANGRMFATITGHDGAIVMIGNCTAI